MRVLPDTPVWSAAFRRGDDVAGSYREEMVKLVNRGLVEIIDARIGRLGGVARAPPGGYTAEVTGADGGTGVALCAIYQLP